MLSRRTLLAVLLSAPICSRAAEPPRKEAEAVAPPVDASDYEQAIYLLKRGRRYEKAAERLEAARMKTPGAWRVWAALGCACAGRVASIRYASLFAGELARAQAAYPKELADWKAAQRDPKADGYGDPRPIEPPARTFPTKDDGIPYQFTPEQMKTKVSGLATRARDAFAKAEQLAQTPSDKAEAAYLHGWALRILATYSPGTSDFTGAAEAAIEESTPAPLYPAPTTEEIAVAFRRATDAVPDVAVYWRAQGDAQEGDEAEKAYRRYLEREPRDATVWFRLYNRAASDEKKRTQALSDLRQAIRYDGTNAILHYEEATMLFKGTSFSLVWENIGTRVVAGGYDAELAKSKKADARQAAEDAVAAVQRGNAAPEMRVMTYKENVPRLLASAWEYGAMLHYELPGYGRLRELARALSGLALVRVREDKNINGGRDAAHAIIGIGLRLAKDWSVTDEYAGDPRLMNTLVGVAITSMGLRTATQIEEDGGDAQSLQAAQNEADAFKQKSDTYRKATQTAMASPDNLFKLY